MARGLVVHDQKLALWGGVLAIVAGSLLLHQAYEARGKTRPWPIKLLPGA